MKEFPRKFLSLRDKNGVHRRSKSVPAGNKARPLIADGFLSIFKTDHAKSSKLEDEKIKKTRRLLDELNITGVTSDHIKDILVTHYAEGEPSKAAEFIDMEQKAAAGQLSCYDPEVKMAGAENREFVTCYLDALLFAMFARIDAFESVLKMDFPEDDHRHKLVNLLRLWVNMLRTGKLIRTDMTKLIQGALGDCGWADARMTEQQDTSEAFAFITETLQLPLLSLQVDLFHHGRKDEDDHKVVYERLLNLAVPPDPEQKGVRLEDCLEDYFNAKVDVLRDSEVARKPGLDDVRTNPVRRSFTPLPHETSKTPETTVSCVADDQEQTLEAESDANKLEEKAVSQVTFAELSHPEASSHKKADGDVPMRRFSTRTRSGSVIQNVIIDNEGRSRSIDNDTMLDRARRKGSTVVKAVTIPAWQFFRLIPWHALSTKVPQNDSEVAVNFAERPAVGICLKRYMMTEDGVPKRQNTFIDIPDSVRLPHFMLADENTEESDPSRLNTDYKLVLQSVICHRGDSLQSGHYITFARMAPKVLTSNRRHDFDPPPDYEEAQWVKFDDLADPRVERVENIQKAFREEMPYLLFYQIVPMNDAECPLSDGGDTEPPTYDETKVSRDPSPTLSGADKHTSPNAERSDGYFTQTSSEALDRDPVRSKPPSIRLSADFDQGQRSNGAENRSSRHLSTGDDQPNSRRTSINLTESTGDTPTLAPSDNMEGSLPSTSPGDESTASRLSRAASRFTKGRQNRPQSQVGEGRLSVTITRLGGLMKPSSREPLTDSNTISNPALVSNGTLHSSSGSQPNGDVGVDSDRNLQSQETLLNNGSKGTHKRGKSKEKAGEKADSPIERECILM